MNDPLLAAFIGLVAGTLSGAFGIGGGVVMLPAIRLILGYPELVAVGTSLPVILPTALAGAVTHVRNGNVLVRVGLIVGVCGMPASVLGALASRVIGGQAVLIIAAVVIVLAAIGVVRPTVPAARTSAADGSVQRSATPVIRLAVIGLVTGFYSGLLGLGGGFVLVPLLQRFAGLDIKQAIGTSLVGVATLAIPGALTHYAIGNVDLPLALALSAGVVPGAVIGARITISANEQGVRWGFATLLALAGIMLGLSETGLL